MKKAFQAVIVILIVIAVLLWIWTIRAWYVAEPEYEPINVLVSAIISTLIAGLSWLKSRKNSANVSAPPSTSTNIYGDSQTGIMITGGTGVTVNASQNQLNYLLVNANSQKELSEYFEQILGMRSHIGRYNKEQFDAYKSIWTALRKLKFAGDALWKEANEQNMADFYSQLLKTRELVHENAPFFEEQHYVSLHSLLEEFDAYGLGKEELVKMYLAIENRNKLRKWTREIKARVSRRIRQNKDKKIAYENLLDSILISFRDKLSNR